MCCLYEDGSEILIWSILIITKSTIMTNECCSFSSFLQSDIIIGLGSHDVRVALRAVELWKQGLAEFILFSGKSGILTHGKV